MKNARAGRAKLLFLPTKYANFLTFSLPSPLSLLKLPSADVRQPRKCRMVHGTGELHKETYFRCGAIKKDKFNV